MRIRTLIVDDEAPARRKLRRLLAAETDFEVVGEADGGESALEAIQRLAPDLVLLDVQMPGMHGFDVVRSLQGDTRPRIVFVTAHSEHAIRAFEVRAFDYLLKPVTPKRFAIMAARILEDVAQNEHAPTRTQWRELTAGMGTHTRFLSRLLVHEKEKELFLAVEGIDWIDADRNYLHIHAGKEMYTERASIRSLAAALDPAQFLRISRSHIVRLDAVSELHPWSHGDYKVVLKTGVTLMWSRRYRAADKTAFRPK